MNDIFFMENQQHREAVAAVRAFRKRFSVPVVIEHKPESPPPPEGIVYSRVSSKPSLPEVFRKIEKLKMPDKGMSPDEIREQLYPTRSAK